MATEHLRLPGAAGELAASIDHPAGPVRGWALIAHCFACGRKSPAAARIARGLAAHGIGAARIDFTGVGDSPGDLADSGLDRDIADLRAAHAALAAAGRAPGLLVGHSLGGAAALGAAVDLPGVRAVATVAAPYRPGPVLHRFAELFGAPDARGVREITLAGRTVRLSDSFIATLDAHDPAGTLAALGVPLLVLHSPGDEVIGLGHAEALFAGAAWPKALATLDGADHRLVRAGAAARAADLIACWAEPYLA